LPLNMLPVTTSIQPRRGWGAAAGLMGKAALDAYLTRST
jgi:hypothetical protein